MMFDGSISTRARALSGRGLRLAVLLGALLILTPAAVAGADTTATTGITITTENTGAFTIAFTGGDPDGGYTLVDAEGNTQIPVSAVEGNTATVTIDLAWNDNRADSVRVPYTIALSASDLESNVENDAGNVYTLPAASLAITAIDSRPAVPPLPLNTPQTILTSPDTPAAGEGTLALTLKLTIPPSSYPATYTSTLTVSVTFPDQPNP